MYYEEKGLFPINCMEHKGSGYGTSVFLKVRIIICLIKFNSAATLIHVHVVLTNTCQALELT